MAAISNTDDWRSGCSDLVSVLDKARHEGRLTDVQFVLGKGKTRKVFKVHKTILACGSEVFEKMFYGCMPEKKNVIRTQDDPEAFNMLMNHLYGKNKIIKSLASAWKLYLIGDKYLVPKIFDIAKQHIASIQISEDEFWDVVDSDVLSHPLFFEKVHDYLKENVEKILKSKKFLHAQQSFIFELLEMDKLNVKEYNLLVAVTEWGYQNLKPVSAECLVKFYKHIRFSNITCDDYFRFIDCYPKAIEAKSSLEILQYLHTPYGHTLPEWCSLSQVSRRNKYHEGDLAISFVIPPEIPPPVMEEIFIYDFDDV